jgi:adenylosuccinate lyase
MEERNIFLNLSPLDHRYYLANRKDFNELSRYLSEEAAVAYAIRTEAALLRCLVSHTRAISKKAELLKRIARLHRDVSVAEVYDEEEKTRHNIRALVNVIKRKLPGDVRHLVHLGATSMDILDTSFVLRIRDATQRVVLPRLIALENELIGITGDQAETPQIGRTHGQGAVPITFGFAVAEYVSRLGKSIERIDVKSRNLRGKLSGAVGAYNALSIVTGDPLQLEREFLSLLRLMPSDYSTQIVEPEFLLELLLEINTAFGIVANLADDLRNLQRTEIGEVREAFGQSQVGSSTMPQKRNPWNSEHVKSLWKAYCPRVITFFLDQISEHQRDLTNSASSRFIAEFLAGFVGAANRMSKVVTSLKIQGARMAENLKRAGDGIMAEALYVLLSLAGEEEAHEIVRRATLEAEKNGGTLKQVMRESSSLWQKISGIVEERFGTNLDLFLSHPEKYHGIAPAKARMIASDFQKRMESLAEKLEKETKAASN